MGLRHSPKIITNGLVLALDAANDKSYPRSGTVWSSGWAGSFSNPTYSFDGNLSTATIQNGTATYTFAGGGLSVSGTVRIYVAFGASSGQVSGLPNVIVVDGTDVSSKMAAANVYTTGVGAGWIDITSEVGSVFNTIVMTGTGGRSNPSIYAIEVNGQILIDAVAVTAWTDLSDNNNTGTLTNGPTFSAGNLGSIVFDGVNDYVNIANSTSLQVADTFTVCAWIYPTTLAARFAIFSTRAANPAGSWQFEVGIGNGGTNRMALTGVGTWIAESVNNVISTNRWFHICLVKVNNATTGATMYVNGNSITNGTTTAYTISNNTDAKRIATSNGTTELFTGNIAQTSLYNRALSATEILQNYNATKSRFGL